MTDTTIALAVAYGHAHAAAELAAAASAAAATTPAWRHADSAHAAALESREQAWRAFLASCDADRAGTP